MCIYLWCFLSIFLCWSSTGIYSFKKSPTKSSSGLHKLFNGFLLFFSWSSVYLDDLLLYYRFCSTALKYTMACVRRHSLHFSFRLAVVLNNVVGNDTPALYLIDLLFPIISLKWLSTLVCVTSATSWVMKPSGVFLFVILQFSSLKENTFHCCTGIKCLTRVASAL